VTASGVNYVVRRVYLAITAKLSLKRVKRSMCMLYKHISLKFTVKFVTLRQLKKTFIATHML